jgi:hypothetical protein
VSVRLVLSCDGHRRGGRCRGARIAGLGSSPVLGAAGRALGLVGALSALVHGDYPGEVWSRLPDGRMLCPSGGHDEDVQGVAG